MREEAADPGADLLEHADKSVALLLGLGRFALNLCGTALDLADHVVFLRLVDIAAADHADGLARRFIKEIVAVAETRSLCLFADEILIVHVFFQLVRFTVFAVVLVFGSRFFRLRLFRRFLFRLFRSFFDCFLRRLFRSFFGCFLCRFFRGFFGCLLCRFFRSFFDRFLSRFFL